MYQLLVPLSLLSSIPTTVTGPSRREITQAKPIKIISRTRVRKGKALPFYMMP
jgi:hypothetical protein